MEDTQIMEIWDLFLEHIPEKHRGIAATQYVEYLINTDDVELEDLESLIGNDDYLDEAIEEALEEAALHDDEDLYDDGDD